MIPVPPRSPRPFCCVWPHGCRTGPSAIEASRATLQALVTNFLSAGGVLLHGSWGRMRHIGPGKPRLGRFPQEDVMPYGNYWIAECLYREMSDDWSVLSLTESI